MNTTTVAQSQESVNTHTPPAQMPPGPAILPEAACAMTARVFVKAISCEPVLVTGRGQTGAEAARNLLESCAALRTQADAPPPLASRTQRLSAMLACGLKHAMAHTDQKLVERLLKAAALVLAGSVVHTGEGAYQVRSQTEPTTTFYEVHGRTCSCPDSRRHDEDVAAYRCKHVLAACLVMKLDDQEKS